MDSHSRWKAFTQFVYGLTGYQFVRHAVEMRREAESLFMLATMGDLLGVPILPPIYSLRLVPYVAPEISAWKRRTAVRREFWEKEEYDLQGM